MRPHEELVIEAGGTVETKDCNGVVAGLEARPSRRACSSRRRRRPGPTPPSAQLAQAAKGNDTLEPAACAGRPACATGSSTCRASPTRHTGAAEALADGKGVCQDHAHIFIAAARTLGVPARYITGYLVIGRGEHGGRASRLGRGVGRGAGLGRLRRRQPHLPDRALRAAGRRARRRLRRPHRRLARGRRRREARRLRRGRSSRARSSSEQAQGGGRIAPARRGFLERGMSSAERGPFKPSATACCNAAGPMAAAKVSGRTHSA